MLLTLWQQLHIERMMILYRTLRKPDQPWIRLALKNLPFQQEFQNRNIFHIVKQSLPQGTLDQQTTRKDFAALSVRGKTILQLISIDLVYRTTFSMGQRINETFKRIGQKTKY